MPATQIKVFTVVLLILTLLAIGTVVYKAIEGWSLIDSLYFTTVTLTTIGYGDLHPTHDASKLFTIVFAFSGVGIFLFSLTILAEHSFHKRASQLERHVMKIKKNSKRQNRHL